MKKLKSVPVKCLFIIYLFVTLFFSACTNNPIEQSEFIEELDTISRYAWSSSDILNGYILGDIYIIDSNNIIISGTPSPVIYDGAKFSPIEMNDPFFVSSIVSGYDRQNVYFGGGPFNGQAYNNATLKKWDGNSIISYEIPDDSTVSICDILVVGKDKLWINVSEINYAYYFESGIFTKFSLDSGTRDGVFYKDITDNLFLFKIRFGENNAVYIYNYKFINNEFVRISVDTSCHSCDLEDYILRVDTEVINSSRKAFSYFQNDKWIKFCNTDIPNSKFVLYPRAFTGSSIDNFICYSSSFSTPYFNGIFIWNGSKWSMEKSANYIFPPFDINGSMVLHDNRIYLILADLSYNSALIIGKLIK